MKTKIKKLTIALFTSALLAAPSISSAKSTSIGKGGGGEETAAQNLSVPLIVVGDSSTLPISCGTAESPSALVPPTGTPLTGYEVPGYYWVQKVHTWQAQCFSDTEAMVFGNWGDNLEGDAKLKAGSPIRVELVLTNMTEYAEPLTLMKGYSVIKLEPSKLDRLSAYGHQATGEANPAWTNAPGHQGSSHQGISQPNTTWSSTPVDFGYASWLVHDAGITFSVKNKSTGQYVVPVGTKPTSEINATGKLVYGYNLRVAQAGAYRITFVSSPEVTFTGQDAANGGQANPNEVYIDINVIAGSSPGVGKVR